MAEEIKWLIVANFNMIRSPENRNKAGGNIQEMLKFNDAISIFHITGIPLKACKYTWTNKQLNPLLKRLDWFFPSNAWTTAFPNTIATALSRDASDHMPCVITALTSMPRPQVSRFENYWLEHESFLPVLQNSWASPTPHLDKAKIVTAKFKNLRQALKS